MQVVGVTSQQLPVDDSVIAVVSHMFDDRNSSREPSHSRIEGHINAVGLEPGDPRTRSPVGKRIRDALIWGIEHDARAASELVHRLVAEVRACGGFCPDSPNYLGTGAIQNARAVFARLGFEFSSGGEIRRTRLEHFHGPKVTAELLGCAQRARAGAEDAVVDVKTGKDLLESTVAHVIEQLAGDYNERLRFQISLRQAFTLLGLATPGEPRTGAGNPQSEAEIALYQLGCAVNQLRSNAGTGDGRPLLPTISAEDSHIATEGLGLVSEMLLLRLLSNSLEA